MTHEKEFEKLKQLANERKAYIKDEFAWQDCVNWSHQVFGAVELFCWLFPEDADEVSKWWEESERENFCF